MKMLFHTIWTIICDNHGEFKLSDEPTTYMIGNVLYTVSVVYEASDGESVKTLHERFEHLVKSGMIDLHSKTENDTMMLEYAPAAKEKGA